MFNAKNDGKVEKVRPKSPKAPPVITKIDSLTGSELDTPEVNFFRSNSVLKDGEHESTQYGPSRTNTVRLLSIRGRPAELM